MLRAAEIALGIATVAVILLNSSWGEIVGLFAAALLIAGMIYVAALDRVVKKWAGVKRWPTGSEIRKRQRSGRERHP